MKTILIIFGLLVLVGVGYLLFTTYVQTDTEPIQENKEDSLSKDEFDASSIYVTPITHASFVLNWQGETIYVDPVGEVASFAQAKEPDLILLTDIHGDHLSTTTLEGLMTPETQVIAPQAVADLLPASVLERTIVVANGEKITHKDFSVEAIAMYNLPESEDGRHPKGRGNGYVLEKESIRAYIAGDTEGTPEMRALENINIAFIPMGLPYTMSVEDAAEAVLDFAPSSVYPYHYRGEGGLSDVQKFKELVTAGNSEINVVLLKWYPEEFEEAAPSL